MHFTWLIFSNEFNIYTKYQWKNQVVRWLHLNRLFLQLSGFQKAIHCTTNQNLPKNKKSECFNLLSLKEAKRLHFSCWFLWNIDILPSFLSHYRIVSDVVKITAPISTILYSTFSGIAKIKSVQQNYILFSFFPNFYKIFCSKFRKIDLYHIDYVTFIIIDTFVHFFFYPSKTGLFGSSDTNGKRWQWRNLYLTHSESISLAHSNILKTQLTEKRCIYYINYTHASIFEILFRKQGRQNRAKWLHLMRQNW